MHGSTRVAEYWNPVFDISRSLRCWSRAEARIEGSVETSHWGMLLTIPVQGYLETELGPLPARDVAWIELSTMLVWGGLKGIPVRFTDVRSELVGAMSELAVAWSARDSSWSVAGLFADVPLTVIHLPNPFYLRE